VERIVAMTAISTLTQSEARSSPFSKASLYQRRLTPLKVASDFSPLKEKRKTTRIGSSMKASVRTVTAVSARG